MTSQWMSCIRSLRHSKAYLLLASAHLMTVGMCAFGMFHGVLPYYLREIHAHSYNYQILGGNETNLTGSVTNSSTKERIGTDIGVITGTGAGGQLVMSFIASYVLKRFSLRLNWILGSLFNIVAILLAMFANDVIMMCASNILVSSGMLWCFTTMYAYHGEFAKDQQEFNFLVGWTNCFNSLGFIVGYSAVAAAYQFFGRRTTFGVVIGLLTLDLFFRVLLPPMEAGHVIEISLDDDDDDVTMDNDVKESKTAEHQTKKSNNLDSKSLLSKWLRFLRHPMIVLLTMQTISTYICGAIMWSTAPNYLANTLMAEQWQTGLIMGLGQGLGLLSILFLTMATRSPTSRLVVLVACAFLTSLASFVYPWMTTVWTALLPDVTFRAARDVLVTCLITCFSHVVSTQRVGDSRMAYSLFGVCVSVGMLIGNYGSGVLVVMVTFRWTYVGMGVFLFLLCFSYIPYFSMQAVKETQLSRSLNSIHNSCLTLPQMALGGSRSNFGSGSLARSRSHIVSNGSLVRSKCDVIEDV